MGMNLDKSITLVLPPELDRRLIRLARNAGQSKLDYALDVLLEHLGDQEDLLVAEERLVRLRSGETSAASLEDVMRRRGLADQA